MDLRCEHIKFGELIKPAIVEFKCRSSRCGAGKGIVVIHRFDANTGKLIDTKRFKEPRGVTDATDNSTSSVRSAAGADHAVHDRSRNGTGRFIRPVSQ